MSNKLKIGAAIVDTTHLTLYTTDGESIKIRQGDPRIRAILAIVTPACANGGIAELDLDTVGVPPVKAPDESRVFVPDASRNHYQEYEETSGVVKFFKIARKKISDFFNPKAEEKPAPAPVVPVVAPPVPPIAVGILPTKVEEPGTATVEVAQAVEDIPVEVPVVDLLPVPTAEPTKVESAIDEIMKHAVPASDPTFAEIKVDDKKSEHTVIAVVTGGKDGPKIVEDVQAMAPQLAHAVHTKSKGMDRFMERLTSVIDKRRHSAQDLMKFMNKGDLPIADDGCIVIYKVLRRRDGKYVDCHSGKVIQQVGSHVCMAEDLVDHNRNNECSNGLHVAKRQYVKGFSGDVCVIAKVAPEDVIAVPAYDANKMRVCGYHILAELTSSDYALLNQMKPIKDQELLGRVLAGDHVGVLEKVEITAQMGGGLRIKYVGEPHRTPAGEVWTAKPIQVEKDDDQDKDSGIQENASINPLAVHETVQAAKAEALADTSTQEETAAPAAPGKPITPTRAEQAAKLCSMVRDALTPEGKLSAAQAVVNFKKKAKVSWEALSIATDTVAQIEKIVKDALPPEEKKVVDNGRRKLTATVHKEAQIKAAAKQQPKPAKPPKAPKAPLAPAPAPKVSGDKGENLGSYAHRIKSMFPITDKANAEVARQLKKASKKSWIQLGVDPDVSVEIERLANS